MKIMKAAVLATFFSFISISAFSQWEKEIEDVDDAYRIGDYIGASKSNTKFRKKLVKLVV